MVVGVDGSGQSKAALCWAAYHAASAKAPLRVMVAWRMPTDYGWTVPIPDQWDPEAEAQRMLERTVKEALGSHTPPDVTLSVVEGPPAKVLTGASDGASLVVVGSRGRGGFAGMLLGSVSAYVVSHARCPVVVVRDGSEGEPSGTSSKRDAGASPPQCGGSAAPSGTHKC